MLGSPAEYWNMTGTHIFEIFFSNEVVLLTLSAFWFCPGQMRLVTAPQSVSDFLYRGINHAWEGRGLNSAPQSDLVLQIGCWMMPSQSYVGHLVLSL